MAVTSRVTNSKRNKQISGYKALRYMTVGRYNYLIKLFQHLKDQSEDCLYLNIYTPTNSAFGKSFDVFVVTKVGVF